MRRRRRPFACLKEFDKNFSIFNYIIDFNELNIFISVLSGARLTVFSISISSIVGNFIYVVSVSLQYAC